MLYLKCEGQVVRIEKDERLADKYINANTVHFEFCERWKGMKITAQFTQKQGEEEKTFNVLLDEVTHTVTMPNEITAGDVDISAFGVHPETGTRLTSIPVSKKVDKSGFVGDGETPIPPTPDLYNQLLQKIDGAFGDDMQKAVNEYLDENPVAPGATAAEAAQIAKNTQDISALQKKAGVLDGWASDITPTEVRDALRLNYYVKIRTAVGDISRVEFSDWVNSDNLGNVCGHCVIQGPDPQGHTRMMLYELVGRLGDNKWFTYTTTLADKYEFPEPLIGTTLNTTPAQVAEAFLAGRQAVIEYTAANYGVLKFSSFFYAQSLGEIGASTVFDMDGALTAIMLRGNVTTNKWIADYQPTAKSGSAEPLIGSTETVTPAQVVEAMTSGRNVLISYASAEFGVLHFSSVYIVENSNEIVSSGIVLYNGVPILGELVGDIESGGWEFIVLPLMRASID